MSDLYQSYKTFSNNEFGEIRVLEIKNEPWFVGKDIATVLGYKNSSDALKKHVDEEDKGVAKCDTLVGVQDLSVINESGLYSLILCSKLPSAKKFKRWVTSEVLPQIRNTGSYQKPMTPQEMMRVQLGMIDGHEERISNLENNMTIDYGKQQDLKKAVNKRVIEVLGGKKSFAYHELSKKVFSECNHDIQDYFNVNSRNNIPNMRYDEAVQYIETWNPSNNTIIAIRNSNAGMCGDHHAV